MHFTLFHVLRLFFLSLRRSSLIVSGQLSYRHYNLKDKFIHLKYTAIPFEIGEYSHIAEVAQLLVCEYLRSDKEKDSLYHRKS